MDKKSKSIGLRLEPATQAALDALASQMKRSRSSVIRLLIERASNILLEKPKNEKEAAQ